LRIAPAAYGWLSPQSGPEIAPASEEITSFAADAQISRAEAAKRLADQSKLPTLARLAATELGAGYGGLWVEEDDQPIKLGVVSAASGPVPETLRRSAAAAIEGAGLAGRVEVARSRRSESALLRLQHELEDELIAVNAGSEDGIDVQPDLRTGRLEVLTPRPADATDRQAAFLNVVRKRFGSAVRIRRGPGPLILQAADLPSQ
jgi:hypothetical protein